MVVGQEERQWMVIQEERAKTGCLKYRFPLADGLSWRLAVFVYTFEEVDLDEPAKLCSRYAGTHHVILFRL
jgi:hypothetical protein